MNHSYWSKKDLEYIWHPCSQMKDYETLFEEKDLYRIIVFE